jgi:hypothetical protein
MLEDLPSKDFIPHHEIICDEEKTELLNKYSEKELSKILNTDIRKVGVTIKQAYTGQQLLLDVSGFYRVYVMEGTTEVLVQDWTPINRTPNEYYFIFDMRDKIPNQYYVDIQVNTSGEKDTYKRQLTFSIVNTKQS